MSKQLILRCIRSFYTRVSIIFYCFTILKLQIRISCTNHSIEIDGCKFINKILQIFSSFSLLFPFLCFSQAILVENVDKFPRSLERLQERYSSLQSFGLRSNSLDNFVYSILDNYMIYNQ